MLQLFNTIGFNSKDYDWGFMGSYKENNIDFTLMYDRERGFVTINADSRQLKKEVLPSMDIHDPVELKEVLLKVCYLKTFAPNLYQKINEYHSPGA